MNRSLIQTVILITVLLIAVTPLSFFHTCKLQAATNNYMIGCSSTDITGPAAGYVMHGFVKQDRLTKGIHLRQRARAFIIADPEKGKRIAFVSVELSMVTSEIHREVMARLNKRFNGLYSAENVILSATHTHSGAGGFMRYAADGPLGTGFFPEYFNSIVTGIELAMTSAHEQLHPGRILIGHEEVIDAGANRSIVAYHNNPEAERALYSSNTDTEMTLLKFLGGTTGNQPVGTLNWFAVHPTSMTFNNYFISGDSKGYASIKFERQMGVMHRDLNDFVAAFAQSNCGDVTGNLNLNNTGPGKNDFESTRIIGQRQLDVALQLYENVNEELVGPIDIRQTYIDFSQLTVSDIFTNSGEQRTSVAAYGYSFAAGSTEDGGGNPLFKEGMTESNPLIDAISMNMFPDLQPNGQVRQLQQPKAILFAPGIDIKKTGAPKVLPLSICRIGQLVLVVGPAEFTTMAGRRIRSTVKKIFGDSAKHIIIAGYSNAYGGYVCTREEYEVQHYEGGHTLFGPWSLAGYQQEYEKLARAMVKNRPVEPGSIPAGSPIPVKMRKIPYGPDVAPPKAQYGEVVTSPKTDYKKGQSVEVAFWTGHPRNSFPTAGNYLSVQHQLNGDWITVYTDTDWETRCSWNPNRKSDKPCRINIIWNIPNQVKPGNYRIVHHGRYQTESNKSPKLFEAVSNTFHVH
jgi:neutral ceramidase